MNLIKLYAMLPYVDFKCENHNNPNVENFKKEVVIQIWIPKHKKRLMR